MVARVVVEAPLGAHLLPRPGMCAERGGVRVEEEPQQEGGQVCGLGICPNRDKRGIDKRGRKNERIESVIEKGGGGRGASCIAYSYSLSSVLVRPPKVAVQLQP